ncbi:MAG: HAD family hydrolase [Halovenus sp.]
MTAFDAVLFDLDGTLCRRTQDTEQLYRDAFERAGVEPFGEPAGLWAQLEGPPDHDDRIGYIGAGFARLAAQHGRSGVDSLALARALTDLIDDSQVELVPGARAALESAAETGPVGLVTNGPERRQRVKLEVLELLDRFDTVVYADDLHRRKPHALPFERALDTLGITPQQALFVGNSLAYDVAGAQNIGLAAAWIRGDDEPGGYKPEYVIDSLTELPALLEEER